MRDDLVSLIDTTAYLTYRRYRQWTSPEDLRQEMWLWVAAQPDGRVDEMELPSLRWRLRDAGEAYARREKAAQSGYSPDDEVFYSLRTLRQTIGLAFGGLPVATAVNERQGGAGRRAGATPAMEMETFVIDLRKAVKAVPWTVSILKAYASGKPTDPDEVTKALRAVQRKLGGPRPRKEAA
jgi:hypothetical protein